MNSFNNIHISLIMFINIDIKLMSNQLDINYKRNIRSRIHSFNSIQQSAMEPAKLINHPITGQRYIFCNAIGIFILVKI